MGKLLPFTRLMKQAATEKGNSVMAQAKASELLDSYNVVAVLAQQEIVARLALKLARILTALSGQLDKIEAERIALCQKYGTLPEGGTEGPIHYEFEPEQRALFDTEINELQNRDILLTVEQLTVDELSQLKANAAMMIPITWLINDPAAVAAEAEATAPVTT
jgi:hypothetical protein